MSAGSREAATDWGDKVIGNIVDAGAPPIAVLAAEFSDGELPGAKVTRVIVAAAAHELHLRDPWTWTRPEALGRHETLASAVALAKVQALSNHHLDQVVVGLLAASGAGPPKLMPAPDEQAVDRTAFRRVADEGLAEQALLKIDLQSAQDEPGDEGYLASWARRVATGPGPADVPAHLQNTRAALLDEAIGLPFAVPFTPPATAPCPTPPPQQTSYKPRSLDDILLPEGRRLLCAWIERHSRAVKRAWDAGPGTPINFRESLVLGQEYVVPAARGIYWDLLGDVPKPIDYARTPHSHLDLQWFADELRHIQWPDLEIISFLEHGVQFKADLGYDCVLMPHLLSLDAGMHRIDTDLQKLRDLGYYHVKSRLTHFPIRCAPSGSRERKHEANRPRRIEDQGAPRKPLYSTAPSDEPGKQTHLDAPILSLNNAIDIRGTNTDGSPKWPREEKPTIPQIARNNLILRSAARAAGTVVLTFGDDAQNAFNQFPTWAGERWKTATFWRGWDGTEDWAILAALTLGFGISAASNVVQRILSALLALVTREMDELEREHPPTPEEQEWLEARRKALPEGEQLRLYDCAVFTDDPIFQAVGRARTIRLLRAFRKVTRRFGLRMAKEEKRSIGLGITWLGLHVIAALGVVTIPTDKRLRAVDALTKAISGQLAKADAVSLQGLLNHLLPFMGMRGEVVRGLFLLTDDLGPADLVKIIHKSRLGQWLARLQVSSGICTSSVIRPEEARPDLTPRVFLFTDAAKDGTPTPGLGGFLHGYWFAITLPRWLVAGPLELPINVLEFITLPIALVTFWKVAPAVPAILFSDSLASYLATTNNSARRPLMRFVYERTLQLNEFNWWCSAGFWLAHTFGAGNPGADMASRGYFPQLETFCGQLGVPSHRLDPPPEAHALLDALVAEHVSRHAAAVGNPQPYNLCGDGPAASTAREQKRSRYGLALPPPTTTGTAPLQLQSQRRDRPEQHLPRRRCGIALPGTPSPAGASTTEGPPSLPPPISGLRRPPAVDPATSKPPSPSPRRGATEPGLLPGARPRESPDQATPHHLQLRPDAAVLAPLREAVRLAIIDSGAASTAKTDARQQLKWEEFCRLMRTSPIRDCRASNSGEDAAGHLREVELLCIFLVWRYLDMSPRSRSAPAPKPQSAMNAVLAVRRVHRLRYDIEMVKTSKLGRVLKGLLRQFVREHGPEALLPERKEPMRRELLTQILGLPLDWDNDARLFGFRAMMAVCFQAGFRKSEVCLPNGESFGRDRLARSALRWFIGGKYYAALTPGLHRQLRRGDAAVLTSPPSKNDPFGTIFGGIPIYLPYGEESFNAARRLAELELRYPCANRGDTPLFTIDGRSAPFHHSSADSLLKDLLLRVLPESEASKYSMHSFRIGLACALLEAGASRDQIHSLCRWAPNSPSDILYARPNPQSCIRWISQAAHAAVTSVTTRNIPRVDNSDFAEGLSRLVSAASIGG